ncbi:MAG: hypothetical protein NWF01_00200 [Candidatus Bathyarchaeota archaeon]|nr:hypothetical protein [Candidatus Bathyarchaeota archaeon]
MKIQCKKLVIVLSLMLLSFSLVVPVFSQEAASLQVNRVVWGQSLNAPINVGPGSEGVPLIVEIQNLYPGSSINGISGVLSLEGSYFTDIYGNPNATAAGVPEVVELLTPADQVSSMGFFTLTFHLNIKDDALPGTYQLPLNVTYSPVQLLNNTQRLTQPLNVTCTISDTPSAIVVSASPAILNSGDQVKLSGSLNPAIEDANITLAFQEPNGNKFNQTITTKLDGFFNYSYGPLTAGHWTVNASWLGDTQNSGSWAVTSFDVQSPVSLELSVSNDRIKAGFDNQVNITLTNDGEADFSSLDLTYTVPPPLVASGKTQWSFNSLGVGDNLTVPVVLYAPYASIGNTFSSAFTVVCRDDYGQTQNYQFSVGLVIVGNVELGVYDSVVNPAVGVNGSKIEITTTLLNRGNVPALYVNATILTNAVLDLTSESSVYIGDVDANSQSPFTLSANVDKATATGTYPVTLRIDYRNDQNVDYSFNYTFNLQVKMGDQTVTEENGALGLPELGLLISVIAIAACLMIVLYRSRLSKGNTVRA